MHPALPLLLAASTLLAACGESPSASTNPGNAAYKTDFAACDGTVPGAVNKRNAKTGLAWFASPITRWGQIDDGMNACMAEKGWGRVRACTQDELRAGNRTGSLVVTARGVQCADPGKAQPSTSIR